MLSDHVSLLAAQHSVRKLSPLCCQLVDLGKSLKPWIRPVWTRWKRQPAATTKENVSVGCLSNAVSGDKSAVSLSCRQRRMSLWATYALSWLVAT